MATIFASQQDYQSRAAVVRAYPDAAKIVKVCGGWRVFTDITDYYTWRKQQ